MNQLYIKATRQFLLLTATQDIAEKEISKQTEVQKESLGLTKKSLDLLVYLHSGVPSIEHSPIFGRHSANTNHP